MCTKQYSKINLSKVSPNALKRNHKALSTHEEYNIKLDKYQIDRLRGMSLSDFMKEVFQNNYPQDKLIQIWNESKYEIPWLKDTIQNTICIMDITKDMFENNSYYQSIGISLLIDKLSTQNPKLICNNSIVDLQGTLFEKKDQIISYTSPSRPIITQKYYTQYPNVPITFITHQPITLNPISLHIIPFCDNNYDIFKINPDTNTPRKVSVYKDTNKTTSKEQIQTLTHDSRELNDFVTPIYTIIIMCAILFIINIL